ncbi:hypothetical protein IPA_03580 [Ignicoccus pacificus DSM 13166]|uniref:SpoVT-AbrB domain-containing protein n=1 Tax=Ignicoccus pacificus DSM 13166 TaxID=940294 RepID=A0A977KAY2_9CREN|nr:hypothetical protein IPA_03580 [Ignicoccus pacificus DSM 13166]
MIEQRKLVKLGKSTLVISLPAEWVRKKGLKAGDTLTLYIDENEITIIPSTLGSSHKITATIRVKRIEDEVLYRMIVSAYIAGAQDITIELEDTSLMKEVLKQVKNATSHLIGLEMVDQSLNKVVLQAFTDVHAQSLESLINRILKLMILMLDHLKEEKIDLSYLNDLENEIDKLYRLTMRRANLTHEFSRYSLTFLPSFLLMLETVSDSIIPLANALEGNYKQVADVIEITKETLKFLVTYRIGQGNVMEINKRIEAFEQLEGEIFQRDLPQTLRYRCLNFIHLLKNALLVVFNMEVAELIKKSKVIVL